MKYFEILVFGSQRRGEVQEMCREIGHELIVVENEMKRL